jgi:Phytanoyl-CoA dioxygenase (PhyH)
VHLIEADTGRAPGALRITVEQRRRFAEDGFFVVEDALGGDEVQALLAVVDTFDARVRRERRLPPGALVRVRNIVCRHPAFLALMDHPRMLPLVVDTLGPRIQLRGSNLDVRPPQSRHEHTAPLGAADSFFPWHRDEPYEGWPTVDGVPPFLELKVGYYLTDLTERDSGALCVVRGSHARPPVVGPDGAPIVDPDQVVEINVPAGAALVWRTALLHCVTPNFSERTRKCLYLAYQHRWLRPSDYISAPGDVLAGCTPIQRQLLGSGANGPLAVSDPDVEPCSPYWTPSPEDVPLEAWAERHGFRADLADHNVPIER